MHHILQNDNGSGFTTQIISDLKELWPELVKAHRKPLHLQSQGPVERANYDIRDILVAWMSENDTVDWTVGVKFVSQEFEFQCDLMQPYLASKPALV